MSQRFKDYENKEEDSGPLGFEIPDVKNILGGLNAQLTRREEVQREHQDQMEEEEKEVKKGKRKPRQKPEGGTICFCGNPHCNIGEFVQIRE